MYSVPCLLYFLSHHCIILNLLGMDIISLNVNSISILVCWCCLVDSYLVNSLLFTSLSSSSAKAFFLLLRWAEYIWAWICLYGQPIWVLWYAVSSNQLSQTLYSSCSGFPPLLCLFLPDAASCWVWLEDIQSVLLSAACILQLSFDLISLFFPSSPFQFWSSSRVSLSNRFVPVDL